jgi:hypothetical protein
MGITVTWDNEADKRTIRLDIGNSWTWEDLEQALRTGDKLAGRIAKPVNIILNYRPDFRPRIATSEQIKGVIDAHGANIRQVVIISDDLFIKKRTEAFRTAYPDFSERIHIAPTLEAGREYLARSYQAPEGR